MILRPWEAGAAYTAGDYVADPKTGVTYMIICPEHEALDCEVIVNDTPPRRNAVQFQRAYKDDVPDR